MNMEITGSGVSRPRVTSANANTTVPRRTKSPAVAATQSKRPNSAAPIFGSASMMPASKQALAPRPLPAKKSTPSPTTRSSEDTKVLVTSTAPRRASATTPRQSLLEVSLVDNLKKQIKCLESQIVCLKRQQVTESIASRRTSRRSSRVQSEGAPCVVTVSEHTHTDPVPSYPKMAPLGLIKKVPEAYQVELASLQANMERSMVDCAAVQNLYHDTVRQKESMGAEIADLRAALRGAEASLCAALAEKRSALELLHAEQTKRRNIEDSMKEAHERELATHSPQLVDVLHQKDFYKVQTERLRVQESLLTSRVNALEEALKTERAESASLEAQLCGELDRVAFLEDHNKLMNEYVSNIGGRFIALTATLRSLLNTSQESLDRVGLACGGKEGVQQAVGELEDAVTALKSKEENMQSSPPASPELVVPVAVEVPPVEVPPASPELVVEVPPVPTPTPPASPELAVPAVVEIPPVEVPPASPELVVEVPPVPTPTPPASPELAVPAVVEIPSALPTPSASMESIAELPAESSFTAVIPPSVSAVPAPPLASIPGPPVASVPLPPASTVPPPPPAAIPGPPPASVPAPPASTVPLPPSAVIPGAPLASVPAPPAGAVPLPPPATVQSPTSPLAGSTDFSVKAQLTSMEAQIEAEEKALLEFLEKRGAPVPPAVE